MTIKRMWRAIEQFNDKYFPNWRNRDLVFYSNALAGEVGELCNEVNHLYGGGTKKHIDKDINTFKARIESVDVFIQLVLFLGAQGLDASDFECYFNMKMSKIEERMQASSGK